MFPYSLPLEVCSALAACRKEAQAVSPNRWPALGVEILLLLLLLLLLLFVVVIIIIIIVDAFRRLAQARG